jgi:hypothetical protein
MTHADFHLTIGRIRRQHWVHYPIQGLLMAFTVLAGSGHAAQGPTLEPALATWPILLLLGAVFPFLGLLTYASYRRLRPSLRRPAEENLRVYQSWIFLRNSLLCFLALPLLVSYVFTHQPLELVASGGILLALSWQTVPSAAAYQRWLLGQR